MNSNQIAHKLLELYHTEEEKGVDCYNEICMWIREYHILYGRDEFIKEFIRDYDCLRRQEVRWDI